MIFGTGFFLFIVALVVTLSNRPAEASTATATVGLCGLVLMLGSICMLIAKVMP